MPFFVPSEHLTLNFADRVRHSGNGDRWNLDMPNLHFELSNALKQKAVPFPSSMESLHHFIGMAQQTLKLECIVFQDFQIAPLYVLARFGRANCRR
jgi:hypothetical protein